MTPTTPQRGAREVLQDHLELVRQGNLDDDLRRNYAEDVVFITGFGLYDGHGGARALFERLSSLLPEASFQYRTVEVRGEMGFLEWTGVSPRGHVRDGVDSYLIRDGRIRAQTIHYTVEEMAPHPTSEP